MNFDGLKASGVGATFISIVGDEISARSCLSSIGIIFFRLVGAYSASIGGSATSGYLVFVDEEDRVCAFDIARRKPLSLLSKFDSARGKPSLFVKGVVDEIPVLK